MSQKRHWIFLRGLARQSGHWGPFIDTFKKTFPQDEIELLDLRGNGELNYSESYSRHIDNVRDLRHRSRFIKEEKSVYLMTISMGSMIGVEWAWQYPDEIDGIVMVNTSDAGSSSFYERLRPRNYGKLLELILFQKDIVEREKAILHMMVNQPNENQVEYWSEVFSHLPQTTKKNFLNQILASSKYRFPNSRPSCPMLLLASEQDGFVSSKCTKNLSEKWELPATYHPTAGHDLCFEDGQWICEQIKNAKDFQITTASEHPDKNL